MWRWTEGYCPKAEALYPLIENDTFHFCCSALGELKCQASIMRWFVTELPVRAILSSLTWTTGSGLSLSSIQMIRTSRSKPNHDHRLLQWPEWAVSMWKPLPPLNQSGGEILRGLQGNIKWQREMGPNPQATWTFKCDHVSYFTSYCEERVNGVQ